MAGLFANPFAPAAAANPFAAAAGELWRRRCRHALLTNIPSATPTQDGSATAMR